MAGKEAGRNGSIQHTNELGENQRLIRQRRWIPICMATALVVGWVAASAAQAPPSQLQAATKPKDPNVAAVVNGQAISRAQLAKECIRRFGKDVLESEVNKHLILQACQSKGVEITREDIEQEVARMANKFGLSIDRWLQMLSEERGISADQYRRDIVWPTVALRKLAASDTQVTASELQEAFDAEFGASVEVRIIVAKTAQKANQLLQQAKQSPDQFENLAKDLSEDENSAATRGLIPPIRRHRGDPKIEQVAFSLQPGQISPVVKTAGQFLIMKCERHLPKAKLTDEQRKKAAVMLRDKLSEKKLRTAANGMFAKLQSEATIVNVLNDPAKQKTMPGVAATVNGKQVSTKSLGEQCLLRHGETVLDGEINRALLKQALKRRGGEVTQKDLQLEIYRAAESFGFNDAQGKPDVNGWLKKVTDENEVTVDTYVRDAVWPTAALKKLVGNTVKVTEEDIQRGFQSNYGERVEILAIVLASQRTAHEVFDLARQNKSEKFFGQLAHQYSIEPVSRSNYGQVPPIRQYGGQPLIEQEAFKLKPGEISGVLAIGDKFTVLRCLGRTKPVITDINVVREELVKDLREKKQRVVMAREFDNLQQSAQIDNFMVGTSQTAGSAPLTKSLAQPVNYEAPSKPTAPKRRASAPTAKR